MKQMFKIFTILALLTLGANAFNYNSVWVNTSHSERGVKKLQIRNNGIVEAFGSCQAGNCSWGRTEYIRTQNGLLATWKRPGKGCKVILVEAVRGNRIKVITKHLFGGQRGDRTKISYFRERRQASHFSRAYDGVWIDEEMHSRGLDRLKIRRVGNQTFVRAWSQCSRPDCDWGRATAIVMPNKLIVEWNRRGAKKVMKIKGVERDRYGRFQTLKVKIQTYFNNGRSPKTHIKYLRREYR